MSLNDTPRATRLHIGLYGRRNSGKSSLLNALTGQSVATVSEVAGTTTDPVYKAMELHGIGPVVFIDTAGFDDEGTLGELRVGKTQDAAKATDMAMVLFHDADMTEELAWVAKFRRHETPVIPVVSQADTLPDGGKALAATVAEKIGTQPVIVSAVEGKGIEQLRAEIVRKLPEGYDLQVVNVRGGKIVASVLSQDMTKPQLYLSIAYDELYGDVARMNDLSEEDFSHTVDEMLQNTNQITTLLDKLMSEAQGCNENGERRKEEE